MTKTDKKIHILYDATSILNGTKSDALRTGIYFVSCRILEQFAKDERFKITLFINNDSIDNIHNYKKDPLLSRFEYFTNTNNRRFKKNICVHKKNIKITKNFLKKMILFLKIIKNIIYLRLYSSANDNLLEKLDVYFTPFYTFFPEISRYPKIIHFTILYDFIPDIFPQYFPDYFSNTEFWYYKMTRTFNKNNYYFCISESTKNDLYKYYEKSVDKNKLITTYIATSQNFYPNYDKIELRRVLKEIVRDHDGSTKYIFSFCTIEPRKNLIFTIRCFIKFIAKHKIEDLFFYMGGTQWDFFIDKLNKETSNFNEYRDKIVRLGYVKDSDVNVLYSNALFFTYLSQYEGFGMPPLEAMQAGVPVICSNNSSLPEVVGDAAITIDFNNEEQCIKAFEDLYFNEKLRKFYIEKGLERAKMFSWEKTHHSLSNKIVEIFNNP